MKKRMIALAVSVLLLLSLIPMQALAEYIVPFPDEETPGYIKPWYPNADAGNGYNSSVSGEEIYNAMKNQGAPDSFDDDTLTPYGTQQGEPFTLLEHAEIFEYVSCQSKETAVVNFYDNLTEVTKYGMSLPGNATMKSLTDETAGFDDLYFVRGVAFDPTGSGRRDHLAVVGFSFESLMPDLVLCIIDAENNKVIERRTINLGTQLDALYQLLTQNLTIVDSSNLIQITAGDYNGDGRDSLVIYAATDMLEFTYDGSNYGYEMLQYPTRTGVVTSDYLHDAYNYAQMRTDNAKANAKKTDAAAQVYNQLCASLASGDVNGDGIDDLVVLSYTGKADAAYVIGAANATCIPQLSVGYGKKGTGSVSELSVDKMSVGKAQSTTTTYTLACPGVAVGDLDGDGINEIVTAGFFNRSTVSTPVSVNDDQSYNPVAYMLFKTSGSGTLKNFGDFQELARSDTSPIAKDDSLREKEDLFQQLSVECVAMNGLNNKEYVFLSGWFYIMNDDGTLEGTSGNSLTQSLEGTSNPFQSLTTKIDGNDVDEVFIHSASVGNFFNSSKGEESILLVVGYKTHTDANKEGTYYFKQYVFWRHPTVSGAVWCTTFGKEADLMKKMNGDDTTDFVKGNGKANALLLAVDYGNDSVVVKYSGKAFAYTDPTVVAFLQAAPYYSELEAGNSSTQYSYSEGYRVSNGTSSEVSYDVGFTMEAEVPGLKMSMDTGFAFELNEEFVSSIDKTYTTTFEANDQNQVILRQTLMYYYFYEFCDVEIYNSTTKQYETVTGNMVVSAPQYPVLTSVSMDQYNEIATAYNTEVAASAVSGIKARTMDLITDELKEKYFLNNEGNPFAYASSASDYKDSGIPGWDLSKAEVGATDTWMKLSHAGGTQTQTYSVTLEEEQTKSVAEGCYVNTTLMAGGGAFGFSAFAGVSAGYERLDGQSISTASMTSTETSGTVQNLGADLTDYGFDWKLIGWKTDDLFAGVPFVGYAVKNQKDLPMPVDDLKATYNADNQTVTLTFTAPETPTGRMAATHFYAYDDLHDGYVGACSYSATNPNRTITIDVSGYDAPGATFTVIPYHEYNNMRGMPSNEVYCLFVMSSNVVSNLIQELRDKIAALETALEKGDADLADDIADLVAAYEALSKEVEDLEEVQDALSDTMAEADKALQDAIDKVNEDLSAAIEKLSQDTDSAIADLTDAYLSADALLKADIDALSGKLSDLEQTMSEADGALQEAIDKVNADLSAAIENLRQATDEELEQAIADLTEAYTSADALLKADIDALSEKLAALEQTMIEADNALQATIEQVNADLEATKKELESAMAEDVERLNNRITTLNAALDAAYKLADERLQKDIDGLSQRLGELESKHNADIEDLRTELETKHQEDIDALRAELEALKAQIAAQDESNSASIQSLETVNSDQQNSMNTTRTITVICLCIGIISLLANGALLLFLLKKKT